tara:strand:- start:6201 stop:6431 length:231 start_codon:yes stop_codon:yes gene_type:complete
LKEKKEFRREVGDVVDVLETDNGTYFDCEIVSVTCPACGESFTGIIREAGGFIAGHQTYHEFTNAQDVMINAMGGA